MRKVSKKQSAKNQELAKIKKALCERYEDICMICRNEKGTDLMHILPKSLWPEYYTSVWNFIIGCRSCHDMFDSSAAYRRKTGLYEHIKKYDSQAAWKYFQMNNAPNDLSIENKKADI